MLTHHLAEVCLEDTLFDKKTQFSLDDVEKLPHFISSNIDLTTTDALKKSLDKLLEKTKDHPQRNKIRECVIEELKRLIGKCDEAEQKESLYELAYKHAFISDKIEQNASALNEGFFGKAGKEEVTNETSAQRKLRTWWENSEYSKPSENTLHS